MDRRQRKTRKAILEAFEELMSSRHYQQVTVSEIIDRADIGRTTFYAHFETKDELLADMCVSMFDHIFEGVNEECVTHENLKTASLQGKLAHLLYHLRDSHSGVCGKLVSEGEPIFSGYFDKQLTQLFSSEARFGAKGVPQDLSDAVLASAFMRIVSWWLKDGCKSTPEQVTGWFCDLMRL